MRIALLLVLFQFFAPSFFPVVAREVPNSRETAYHVQHSSIAAPLLLKEKDEKELEVTSLENNLTPLLDLTIHSLHLKASHSGKVYYFHTGVLYGAQPQLFTFNCTFLI